MACPVTGWSGAITALGCLWALVTLMLGLAWLLRDRPLGESIVAGDPMKDARYSMPAEPGQADACPTLHPSSHAGPAMPKRSGSGPFERSTALPTREIQSV